MSELYAAWIINQDHVSKNHPIVRQNIIRGPHQITDEEIKRLVAGEGYEFRIFDDDGVLYYVGRCLAKAFDPLDDFGTPGAGATSIEYYNSETKQWEVL